MNLRISATAARDHTVSAHTEKRGGGACRSTRAGFFKKPLPHARGDAMFTVRVQCVILKYLNAEKE